MSDCDSKADYSSMDRQQLLEKIKDRDNKIERYEKRLTDVVVAFKNLQKEKAALEETLRQVDFSSTARKQRLSSPRDAGKCESSVEDKKKSEEVENDAAGLSTESAEAYELRIAKLLESVNALNQQKNDLSAAYQVDKRKIREEYEHTIAEQKRNLESCAIVRRDFEAQLAELRSRARQQAKLEQDTGALSARLAAETAARESAESQLADVRRKLSDANRAAASQEAAHRRALNQLERSTETRLAEAAANTGERETRADELEARVAQLAASLGEADRRRQADARSAGRLRERLDCLDRENRQLRLQLQNATSATATAAVDAGGGGGGGGGGAHPVAVVEPVQRRSLAQQFSTESGKSDDAGSYSFYDSSTALDGDDSAIGVDVHAACQEQVRQLRAELDSCRLRLLTMPPTPPPSATQSSQQQSELQRVQRDLRACRDRCHTMETEAARQEQAYQERHASAERRHRDETARLRRELTARALEAEAELARHRDRTLRLLSEKDAELKEARSGQSNRTAATGGGGSARNSVELDEALLLSHMRSSAAACTSVHAQLEGALAQADMATLREARRQAEHRLRSLQAELVEQRQTIAELRVELARCQQPTQESAEYVRNLVYHYLTLSDDCRTKKTVLTAMCTVLNFSDSERHKALQKQFPTSWW